MEHANVIVRTTSLDDVPILLNLSPSTRARLSENSIQHTVAAGTVLFEQGDAPNFQYVIVEGSVQLFGRSSEGREVLIETVGAPHLVIPAAVVTGAPFLMQARVPEPSRFLLIHAAIFREAITSDSALAQAVIGDLARQFRRMVRQIKNLKLRPSVERVGCYILALSSHQGTTNNIVLPYEKNLIASELGITRESFSRALARLEKTSIRVRGQIIDITDADRLALECKPDPLIDGQD